MKKIVISFILFTICLGAFLGFKTSAAESRNIGDFTVSTINGAQIRTEEPNGMMFIGQVTGNIVGNDIDYGIVLGKGIQTNLTVDTPLAATATVEKTDDEGNFYVTMINFPEIAYPLYVTARAYVIVDGVYTYAEEHVLKSLWGLAKTYSQLDGYDPSVEILNEEILAAVTPREVAYYLNGGNVTYVTREEWVAEFVNDFNDFTGRDVLPDGSNFFARSWFNPTGELNNAGYKFLTSETYSEKWGWVLTYINLVRVSNGKAELAAGDDQAHTRGEIHNFLNKTGNGNKGGNKSYGCDYSDFEVSEGYWQVFPDQFLGEEEVELKIPYKPYHTFEGWYLAEELTGNQVDLITDSTTVLYAKWSKKIYTLTYVLNNVNASLSSNTKEFTVTDEFLLEEPTYDTSVDKFLGWYLDPEFTTPIENIEYYTSTSMKVYAKWQSDDAYDIVYNLNGGNTKYANHNELVDDLINDFNQYINKYYNQPANKYPLEDGTIMDSGNYEEISTWGNFFDDEVYGEKWAWLANYLNDCAINDAGSSTKADMAAYIAGTSSGDTAKYGLSYQVRAFILKTQLRTGNAWASTNFTLKENVDGWADALSKTEDGKVEGNVGTIVLPTLYKPYYGFLGWYTTSDFTGEAVTEVSRPTTLYAKWESYLYDVTYVLNGGNLSYGSREELVADLIKDFNTDASKTYALDGSDMPSGNDDLVGEWGNFFDDKVYGEKWAWLAKYFNECAINDATTGSNTKAYLAKLIDGTATSNDTVNVRYAISNQAKAFILKTQLRADNSYWRSSNFANEKYNNGFWNKIIERDATYVLEDNYGEISVLDNIYNSNQTLKFVGWYTTSDFSGEPVTVINGNTTLYAKWEQIKVIYDANGGIFDKNTILENAEILKEAKLTKYDTYQQGGIEASLHSTKPTALWWYYIVLDKTSIDGVYEISAIVYKNSNLPTNFDYAIAWHDNLTDAQTKQVLDEIYNNSGKYIGKYILLENVPTESSESCNVSVKLINIDLNSELTKVCKNGEAVLTAPTREGYTFAGWYDNPECTGDVVTNINESCTLYAKWEIA